VKFHSNRFDFQNEQRYHSLDSNSDSDSGDAWFQVCNQRTRNKRNSCDG
jgi:hypothetical protein